MRSGHGSLLALVLVLVLAGCGDDGRTPTGARTSTGATGPTGAAGDLAGRVEASGELTRMAVVAGDAAAEPVILENCLSDEFADYRAAAPPCRPIAHVGVLPA